MPGFWDDEEVKNAAAGGAYASLKDVGDEVDGEVASLTKRKFNEGKADERTAIEVAFKDGPTLTAGQVLLMRALYDLRPEPGDHLRIQLAEVEKRGTKTLKKFRVDLKRASGESESVDQTK